MSPFINEHPILLLVLVIWTLPWKIFALWNAAKNNHKGWFIALIILNTFAILEIFYIFVIAKKTWKDIKRTLLNILSSKK